MYKLTPELYGLEAGAERQQRFGVAQQQVAARLKQRINQIERLAGGLLVKVNQKIAAEEDVEAAAIGRWLQAVRFGGDQVRLFKLHGGAQALAGLPETAPGVCEIIL